MFNPTCLGINLSEFFLRHLDYASGFIENYCTRRSSALVKRYYVLRNLSLRHILCSHKIYTRTQNVGKYDLILFYGSLDGYVSDSFEYVKHLVLWHACASLNTDHTHSTALDLHYGSNHSLGAYDFFPRVFISARTGIAANFYIILVAVVDLEVTPHRTTDTNHLFHNHSPLSVTVIESAFCAFAIASALSTTDSISPGVTICFLRE